MVRRPARHLPKKRAPPAGLLESLRVDCDNKAGRETPQSRLGADPA